MADPRSEIAELRSRLRLLEEEATVLRRRLEESPPRIRALEERLLEAKGRLSAATAQNGKLAETLREAREQILALKQQVEKLSAPPSGYGVYLRTLDDETVEVFAQGRKLRVHVSPDVEAAALTRGQEVVLNESLNVVEAAGYEAVGDVMTLKERIEETRAIVLGHTDDEQVVRLAAPLMETPLRAGDSLLVDTRSGHALERLPRPEVEELVLEEVPDIAYEDIGGLGPQIEAIRDAVELPFMHADLFAEHHLKAPKGILLYGPPGCGKTMIAKAVANSLTKRVAEKEGRDARSYFLNIKGPELLNKYVGETERQIRLIFQRAREKVAEGHPVIVFFDEMDSIFRTRGSGVSSDVENTIVPQLLSEIDGVEQLKDVIVIGASNREDMIDPAILRPGRLDVKIKIERPDRTAAREIFSIYLYPELPLHPDFVKEHDGDERRAVDWLIGETCRRMYSDAAENRFLEVTYANGDKEVLYFKDFNSGAMIENVVARAKKTAIKRFLDEGQRGIKPEDLFQAVRDEFKENEDLPNTTNPDDWARISGKKGERIVYVRTLIGDGTEPGKSIENVNAGTYL